MNANMQILPTDYIRPVTPIPPGMIGAETKDETTNVVFGNHGLVPFVQSSAYTYPIPSMVVLQPVQPDPAMAALPLGSRMLQQQGDPNRLDAAVEMPPLASQSPAGRHPKNVATVLGVAALGTGLAAEVAFSFLPDDFIAKETLILGFAAIAAVFCSTVYCVKKCCERRQNPG